MKIAHVSDTHLGYAQYNLKERKKDFFKAFSMVVDRCIEEGVELLLHTGDFFETYHPDVETLSFAVSQLRRLKDAGVKVVAIAGNHDRVVRRGVFPPHKLLKELELIEFIDPVGELEYGGIYLAGFRFFPKRLMEFLKRDYFPKFEERAAKADFSILLFHQAVDKYLPKGGAYELLFPELPKGFSYYAAGHIHIPRIESLDGGVFSYAGSTEFRSVDEARKVKRGFNLIELPEGRVERVILEGLRAFIVLETDEDRAQEELRELLEEVKSLEEKPLVHLIYSYKKEPVEKFRELLKELENSSLYLRIVKKPVEAQFDFDGDNGNRGISYKDLFQLYCESNGLPKKLIELGKEIISSQPEQIEELVEHFLKEELGETFKLLKEFEE
jgi:DNA repair exonuclease SbcCD nuclease subunit